MANTLPQNRKPTPKKRSGANGFLLLFPLLIICLVVFFLIALANSDAPADTSSASGNDASAIPTASETGDASSGTVSVIPIDPGTESNTASDTESDVSADLPDPEVSDGEVSTEVSEPTEEPTEDPSAAYVGKKGQIIGETGTDLKLVVDYEVVNTDGKVQVQIKTYIRCWSLYANEKAVNIEVNGNSKTVRSPAYHFDGTQQTLVPYGERLVDLNGADTLDIRVSIPFFKIEYSDVLINSIEAHETVHLG